MSVALAGPASSRMALISVDRDRTARAATQSFARYHSQNRHSAGSSRPGRLFRSGWNAMRTGSKEKENESRGRLRPSPVALMNASFSGQKRKKMLACSPGQPSLGSVPLLERSSGGRSQDRSTGGTVRHLPQPPDSRSRRPLARACAKY